jgi:hypothetical protein
MPVSNGLIIGNTLDHSKACHSDEMNGEFSSGEQNTKHAKLPSVDEGRKRVILIAASILAARKLAQFDGGKRVPATISAIADVVHWAEEIMKEIDARWPTRYANDQN